ncbi:acetyl-CoA hydrolase/transferase C-terminal domain-containing protein [Pelagibacterium lentulum]|uniref:Acetyl-CoA hydrolase n=1 Tax=Pelagibacterium lentulum TaxID=2029865 RepID=A0A916RL50_9HYPH|nr:acetyl-CoA hydrolase/transferase C-terminal domain-containing protein [Pelagibacterium lentulum]GGA60207.1 acetyl-CoA hydrolase [Pelagibacterium lentulum]
MTERLSSQDHVIDWILEHVGRDLRVAMPLGLGKPVELINALVERAAKDPSIRLHIFTALTLERPKPSSDMEERFLGPALDRLFGKYPEIEYARLMREDKLPDNIRVTEFFLQAANWLKVPAMQHSYVSANYTHALDVLLSHQPNVVLHLLAGIEDRQSLSCNTDITADLIKLRAEGKADFKLIAQVHPDLPFMAGTGEIHPNECAVVLDTTPAHDLFSVVKRPVGLPEHAIGLHVSRLIRDGGTLQIGIGEIGDAVAHALILRERETIAPIWTDCPFPRSEKFAQTGRFETGLYGVTEMLVDGLLALFENGIIKREVHGAAIHAGFFLDSRAFYERLNALPESERARIAMMPVSFTNALYGDEPAKRAARRDARFVNAAMMVTLLGAAVSDGTEDGQVVSGVGGQFNFVEQAFALEDGHAIITLSATRESKGKVQSNIIYSYGHMTIPRHMRDIVVTEYGIADLRGKSDAATIAALLEIADSRFQSDLEREAKKAGKLPDDYRLPEAARNNTPDALEAWLSPHRQDKLADYPFGTDFTDIEQYLIPALAELRSASAHRSALFKLVLAGMKGKPAAREKEALERMDLVAPKGFKTRLTALALKGALRKGEQG